MNTPSSEPHELAVIMPVYNEAAVIGTVLAKWAAELDRLGLDYQIHAYNDGSRDATLAALQRAAAEHPRVCVHDKRNSGHGPTILLGYREHTDARWIFQVDSDDEMGPEHFHALWERRSRCDFLIGTRAQRASPWPRRVMSLVSRLVVRLCYGRGVYDVNAPYRLMRTAAFEPLIAAVPPDTFAPNVILAGLACLHKLRIFETPVPHQCRQTGEVSIRSFKLIKVSLRSFRQTIGFRVHLACENARRLLHLHPGRAAAPLPASAAGRP